MKKKNYFYIDMDGVLADFFAQPDCIERFAVEPRFFANLTPIESNVNAVVRLIEQGESVRILSKSPHKNADRDKLEWLNRFLPQLPQDHIIIIRNSDSKNDHMRTQHGILFDDYGKNCREWEKKQGNIAVKITATFTIENALKEMGIF